MTERISAKFVVRVAIIVGVVALAALLAWVLLSRVSDKTDYTARFLRYTTIRDGTKVAVVKPIGLGTDEQIASTDIRDLKEGDLVRVRAFGRGWDVAQWVPEREVVSRAPAR